MKKEKGFTGIELSISIVIMVLFLGLLMSIFYQIYLTTIKINRGTIANSFIVTIFEKIETMNYETIKEGSIWVWISRFSYCIKSGYHCNGLAKENNGVTKQGLLILMDFELS